MNLRALRKKPLHIIIPTIFSVAVAIFAFLVIMGIKDGVTRQIDRIIAENGLGTKRIVLKHNERRVTPTLQQYEALQQITEFKAVAGETSGWMTAPRDETYIFRGLGVTEDFFAIRRFPLESGRYFTAEEIEWGEPVMVIGAGIRAKLFNDDDPLGQTIRHYGVDYTVVGTLKEVQDERAFEEMTNSMVFCPYTAINNIPVGGRLSQFWVDSGSLDVKEVQSLIKSYNVFPAEFEVEVLPQDEIWAYFFQTKNQVLSLLIIISLVIMILAGLNVMMVSLASINQRLYEIGVKKAVGAAGESIFMDLVKQTLVLFVAGGAIGMTCFYLFRYPIETVIHESILPGFRLLTIGASMLLAVGFLVSLYPALLGARLTPLQALYRRGGLVNRLKKDMTRRVFVIVGVVISIIAITIISMVSGGYMKQVDALLDIFSEDLLYIKFSQEVPSSFLQAPEVTYELYEAIRNEVTGMTSLTWTNIRYGESVRVNADSYPMVIFDVEPEFFDILKLKLGQGRVFKDETEVILGAKAAEFFKYRSDLELAIEYDNYTVCGVLADLPTEVGGLRRFDYGSYIFKKARPEAYDGREYNHEIVIRVEDPANLEMVVSQINTVAKRLYPEKGDVSIVRPAVYNAKYRGQMQTIRTVCLIYAVISLLVSGIGIMNLMLVNVGTRAKEIGIRRAVGASRGEIGRMLIYESVILTGVGGLIGITAGLLSALYLAKYFAMEFYFSPLLLVPAVLFSVGTGVLAGLFPAIRASRLEPVRVLKPVGE